MGVETSYLALQGQTAISDVHEFIRGMCYLTPNEKLC